MRDALRRESVTVARAADLAPTLQLQNYSKSLKKSMDLEPDDIRTIRAFLSDERLGPFLRMAGSETDAVTLYLQTMRVGAALMPVIGFLEIAIRNAVSTRLTHHFRTDDWIVAERSPFRWKGDESGHLGKALSHARRAAYAKLDPGAKRSLDASAFPEGMPASITHAARSKRRQSAIVATHGQIVAQLTLFFWKRLFSADYETTLWKPILRPIFPNKEVKRAQVAVHLEALYEVRNRIAHHEPIHGARLSKALLAIKFVVENLECPVPDGTSVLARLLDRNRGELAREVALLETLIAGCRARRTADAG